MKKKVFGMKLSRGRSARMALRRTLIRALVLNGKITTTKSKVKFVQRDIEKLVSDSIKADLSKRRKVYAFLANDRNISNRLFEIANGFSSRSSGFTKMTLLPRRRGDNAELARLEWTETVIVADKKQAVSKSGKKKVVTEKPKKENFKTKLTARLAKRDKTETKKVSIKK